jgi:hypothetical protein
VNRAAWSRTGLLTVACLLGSGISRAQDTTDPSDATPPEPVRHLTWNAAPSAGEKTATTDETPATGRHAEQRPFAFLLDPSTPSAGDVGIAYDLRAAAGGPADRPLPSSITVAGVMHELTIDYGASERFAPFASVRLLQPTSSAKGGAVGASAGTRWQLTNPEGPFRLTLVGAGFREAAGSFGAYARLATSYDLDRLRIAGNLHVEKAFAAGRDSVDVLMLAGMSYRVLSEMRFGVEYVGQDLEEAFGDTEGAEGGARHYLGPSLALNLMSDRLQLVAGVGMGLVAHTSGTMGRIGTLMMF